NNAIQLEAERVAVHESFKHNPRPACRNLKLSAAVNRRRLFAIGETNRPIQSNARNFQFMHADMRIISRVELNSKSRGTRSSQSGYVCTRRGFQTSRFELLNRGINTINRSDTTHIQNRYRPTQSGVNYI